MIGRWRPLARLAASIALTGGVVLAASTPAAAAASPGGPGLVAYLGAQRIPLSSVASYHCHDRDYPVIRCFRTAAERVNAALIGASQAGSVSQSWVDYNPLGSTTGNCNSSTTLYIGLPVAGLQYSVVICQQWIMNKSNPAVSYSMEWYGPGTRTTRGIAFDISVRVAQGAWPQWSMPGQSWGGAY
jgi:hypothetical protein